MSERYLESNPIVKRYERNPILTARDVPYRATLVFNAGVTKFRGRYVMVFRNDYAGESPRRLEGTNLGLAWSEDGIRWEVEPEPCFRMETDEIRRAYDPRLTVVEGRAYMCFAVDTRHGIRGGIAVTDDFREFDILSLSTPDNRNMVLFPEKIGGNFARLERPFPVYGRGASEAFDIWYSESPDCRYWGRSELVLGSERVPYANLKIGPAAPPIRTREGWLVLIHAVDRQNGRVFKSWEPIWTKRYTMGAILLDAKEPWKVVAMTKKPLLVPERDYELDGFRGGVIFATGLVREPDGTAKIYYGAADTVLALATVKIADLLAACEPA